MDSNVPEKKVKVTEKTFIHEDSTVDEPLAKLPKLYEPISLKKWSPKHNVRLDKYGKQISTEAQNA